MIIKQDKISEINTDKKKFILLYGKNEGLINKRINEIISTKNKITTYDEKEILKDQTKFIESIFTKSLFETNKTIIIKRSSDKIINTIKEIYNKDFDDIKIIIISENLEKRSKLRSFFEKDKKLICVPFYPDTEQSLSKLAYEFLKKKNILISSSNINSIVNKCNGDRGNLFNDLKKVENYCKNGKKINSEVISKLLSLYENYNISELIDNCLAKNKNKTLNILNENNFISEDSVLITRTFLNKSKRILTLCNNYNYNNNIDLTISSAKPPIFWKDKEIIKQQIFKWSPDNIKLLIYKINELELLVKKNTTNSINLITNFILEQTTTITSN